MPSRVSMQGTLDISYSAHSNCSRISLVRKQSMAEKVLYITTTEDRVPTATAAPLLLTALLAPH